MSKLFTSQIRFGGLQVHFKCVYEGVHLLRLPLLPPLVFHVSLEPLLLLPLRLECIYNEGYGGSACVWGIYYLQHLLPALGPLQAVSAGVCVEPGGAGSGQGDLHQLRLGLIQGTHSAVELRLHNTNR
jgi:hypothetical protein